MGIIPMDKINIFPYFGGNMNNKTLTEQNITSSFKVLGLNSCGYMKYDTTGEVKPFVPSTYESIIAGETDEIKFNLTSGQGQINGYQFQIDIETWSDIPVQPQGEDKWEIGGTLYLQMQEPEDDNSMLTPLYSMDTNQSLLTLQYSQSFKNLPKKTRQWCLPIARMVKGGDDTVISEYTCPTSAFPNITMENGSQFVMNAEMDGIHFGHKWFDQEGQEQLTESLSILQNGVYAGKIEGYNIENFQVYATQSEIKSTNTSVTSNKFEFKTTDGKNKILIDQDNHKFELISDVGILLDAKGQIQVDCPGMTNPPRNISEIITKTDNSNYIIKTATFPDPKEETGNCKYTIIDNVTDSSKQYKRFVHENKEGTVKCKFSHAIMPIGGGTYVGRRADTPVAFEFPLELGGAPYIIKFHSLQVYVERPDDWNTSVGQGCVLTDSYIKFDSVKKETGLYVTRVVIYPQIIGVPSSEENEITLKVHLSTECVCPSNYK